MIAKAYRNEEGNDIGDLMAKRWAGGQDKYRVQKVIIRGVYTIRIRPQCEACATRCISSEPEPLYYNGGPGRTTVHNSNGTSPNCPALGAVWGGGGSTGHQYALSQTEHGVG